MNNIHKLVLIAAFAAATSTLTNCSSGGGGNDDPPPSSSSAGVSSSGGGSSSGGSSSSVAEAPKCGGEEYDTSAKGCCNANLFTLVTQRCENNVIETKCGTGSNYHNPATQFCDGNSAVNKCGGETYAPAEQFCDTRDGGRIYNWTKIGEQVWMADNLNHETEEGSACYGNDEDNCATYGRLYNWATAMGDVCPAGWHLPSQAEWDALNSFIETDKDCSSCDAKHLKAESGWSGGTGLDSYGFAALPGGYGSSSGSFGNVGNYGNWWSATEHDASYAYNRYMYYLSESADWDGGDKSSLLSVRCLQN